MKHYSETFYQAVLAYLLQHGESSLVTDAIVAASKQVDADRQVSYSEFSDAKPTKVTKLIDDTQTKLKQTAPSHQLVPLAHVVYAKPGSASQEPLYALLDLTQKAHVNPEKAYKWLLLNGFTSAGFGTDTQRGEPVVGYSAAILDQLLSHAWEIGQLKL